MRKFGFYNGKEYKNGEKATQCCFNVSDDISETELDEQKSSHRMDCIKCALSCGYSSECTPCQIMRQ